MVVLKKDYNHNWGLNGDVSYMRTALTRSKKKLILMVVNYQFDNNNVMTLVNKGGATQLNNIQFIIDNINNEDAYKLLKSKIEQ